MALPGVQLSDVKRAMSHPQALSQTEGWLKVFVPRFCSCSCVCWLLRFRPDCRPAHGNITCLSKNQSHSITMVASDDTAAAAQQIAKEGIRDCAAVASRRAAELYGLNVLAEGIQDNADNITRFVALSREPIPPRLDVAFKTSIVFSLQEGPGVLFRALSCFALRDIDLSKVPLPLFARGWREE